MSFVIGQIQREVIELPKLPKTEISKPSSSCRQCGGTVPPDRTEPNEFETIKLGDIFTQFTQDSNNSTSSTTSQPGICTQCLTVNSVSSAGEEDNRDLEAARSESGAGRQAPNNGMMAGQGSPSTPMTTGLSILSTAASVIAHHDRMSRNNNNNNEVMMHVFRQEDGEGVQDKFGTMMAESRILVDPKPSDSPNNFILPGEGDYPNPDSTNPQDFYNDNQNAITDSLDDHSELIIIKQEGTPFEFQLQPTIQYAPSPPVTAVHAVPLQYDVKLNVQQPVLRVSTTGSSIIVNNRVSVSIPAQSEARPPPPKVFSCSLCSKVFKNGRIAKAHQDRVHDKLARYFCDTCGGAFSYRGSLNSHVASHHPPVNTFECPTCGKKFKEKSSLSAHFTIVHAENPRKFKCEFCPSAFSKKVNLNYHRKRKHPAQVLSSNVSSGSAMNTQYPPISTGLNGNVPNYSPTSIITHRPIDSVSLIIDSIASNTELAPPLPGPSQTMVNTEGEFKCEECGKGFQFRNNLKAHYKTHTREKAYTCSLCEKSFVYKESLKNHMLLHSGQFPFNCNICHKKFRDRSNRRKHVKNVHKIELAVGAPLPASITSTEPITSGPTAAMVYGNGSSTSVAAYPTPISSTLAPPAQPKRRRPKKATADPLDTYNNPGDPADILKSPKKKAKGKGPEIGLTASSSDPVSRSVIVSPKTVSSTDYGLLSPALPSNLHLGSSLPSFNQQQSFERNIIVKSEPSDHLFMQQQNVIVYPTKPKHLDYPSPAPAQHHAHSVISQVGYFEQQQQQQGDPSRCYQQPGQGVTPAGSMAAYYSHQSISPENTTTGTFDSPSSPYANVGRVSARSSSCSTAPAPSPADPLQQQQQYPYMGDNSGSSLGTEPYAQFWPPSSSAQSPAAGQPYYVVSTTTGTQSGGSPVITAPAYIPPQSTPSTSASNNTNNSNTSSYMYADLTQSFDFSF